MKCSNVSFYHPLFVWWSKKPSSPFLCIGFKDVKTFSVLSLIIDLHTDGKDLLCNLNKCSYIVCQCTLSYRSSSGDRDFQITHDGFTEDACVLYF